MRAMATVLCLAVVGAATPSLAQPVTRTIRVNNHTMRVWSAGFDRRTAGQPAVILEAGSGSSLEAWRPVFQQISRLVPTLAYDRSGLGQSEFDGEKFTLPHVAQTLHALLAAAKILPPYVLAGHSWGGEYIRGFASLYPAEVAGLVYLETTDFERTDEEIVREGGRVGPGNPPPIPESPPGARAEVEQIIRYGSAGFAEIRAMPVPSTLPVAVLIGARPPRTPSNDFALFKRLQIRHQGEWTMASPAGLLLVASQSGHQVMDDVPGLVVEAVKHVLDHATSLPRVVNAAAGSAGWASGSAR
jgi:pimeloyl-ACP methyl ester carboxylesterase